MLYTSVVVVALTHWQIAAVLSEHVCDMPDSDAKDLLLLQTAKRSKGPFETSQDASVGGQILAIDSQSRPSLESVWYTSGEGTMQTGGNVTLDEVKGTIDISQQEAANGFAFEDAPIDFVYCWAGEDTQLVGSNAIPENATVVWTKFHADGFGYNEMELSLEGLHRFAPWFNNAYLLVDGPAELPTWAAKYPRVKMIDRCSLFPSKNDCPTNNTAACQSIVHLVPGLEEKFVYMDDDFIFVNPVLSSDFFASNGNPRLTMFMSDDDILPMYGEPKDLPSGPDMPPAKVPTSYRISAEMIKVHQPIPMTRQFSALLENEYPDWFRFVRSHTTRFTCCDASIHENGLLELFYNMYPAQLYEKHVGMPPIFVNHTEVCSCADSACMRDVLSKQNTKCLGLQNCYDAPTFEAARLLILDRLAPVRALNAANATENGTNSQINANSALEKSATS